MSFSDVVCLFWLTEQVITDRILRWPFSSCLVSFYLMGPWNAPYTRCFTLQQIFLKTPACGTWTWGRYWLRCQEKKNKWRLCHHQVGMEVISKMMRRWCMIQMHRRIMKFPQKCRSVQEAWQVTSHVCPSKVFFFLPLRPIFKLKALLHLAFFFIHIHVLQYIIALNHAKTI